MVMHKVKIFTRSANIVLYHYSQELISLPYPRVRLYDTTADGYLYQMLDDTDCDIAINIDEDAFVLDNDALKTLIDFVLTNDIVCCGMHDGGALPIRSFNPIVMNPFFNIINLRVIREKFNRDEIEQFDYAAQKKELIKKLPEELRKYGGLKYDNYEPYYHFFFWIAKNFKILYLNVTGHEDGITSIVYNQEYKPILLHTWWSREYGKDVIHTSRIKAIIQEAYIKQNKKMPCMFFIKIRRWFESQMQQFDEWWDVWTKVGKGRWIISHLKKSPTYYCRRIKGLLKTNLES